MRAILQNGSRPSHFTTHEPFYTARIKYVQRASHFTRRETNAPPRGGMGGSETWGELAPLAGCRFKAKHRRRLSRQPENRWVPSPPDNGQHLSSHTCFWNSKYPHIQLSAHATGSTDFPRLCCSAQQVARSTPTLTVAAVQDVSNDTAKPTRCRTKRRGLEPSIGLELNSVAAPSPKLRRVEDAPGEVSTQMPGPQSPTLPAVQTNMNEGAAAVWLATSAALGFQGFLPVWGCAIQQWPHSTLSMMTPEPAMSTREAIPDLLRSAESAPQQNLPTVSPTSRADQRKEVRGHSPDSEDAIGVLTARQGKVRSSDLLTVDAQQADHTLVIMSRPLEVHATADNFGASWVGESIGRWNGQCL